MRNILKLSCAAAVITFLAADCNGKSLNAARIGAGDALSVDGNGFLRNRKGREVVLRGVNLGGWMIQESWMCPVFGTDREWANLDTILAMESRGWTAAEIQGLFDTYQDNWITADDFDFLFAHNVNSVRIPFWYRNFMSDEYGAWINGDGGSGADTANPGFKRLDWAVAQAKERGIYVILDLHGAPGGQSMDHCSGTIGKNELYTNEAYERTTADLWRALAARYKDEAAVAAYDLLNEPQNNGGYKGANAWAPDSERAVYETVRIYDRLYREIRSIDPEKIIIMEGIWSMNLPNPKYVHKGPLNIEERYSGKTVEWTNVMYSMHLYDSSVSMINSRVNELVSARRNWGVAIHIGEFKNDNEGNQSYAYERYNSSRISWNMWTYKIAGADMGTWPLYQSPRKSSADPNTDSQEIIRQKWGETLRTFIPQTNNAANEFTRTGMYDLFKSGLGF